MKSKTNLDFKGWFSRHWVALVLVLSGFPSNQAHAAFGFKLDGTLDKEAISHTYFEGDFGKVLPPLEMYRQTFPASSTREDSIFVFKYLSVIYAADSTTRPKAESYMIQLLKLMPTIELVDLYISDNIHAIFKGVRKDFLEQQRYVREHDQFGRPIRDSVSTGKGTPRSKPSRHWIGWTLGGLGTAAVAATAYYVMTDERKTKTNRVVLPSGD